MLQACLRWFCHLLRFCFCLVDDGEVRVTVLTANWTRFTLKFEVQQLVWVADGSGRGCRGLQRGALEMELTSSFVFVRCGCGL